MNGFHPKLIFTTMVLYESYKVPKPTEVVWSRNLLELNHAWSLHLANSVTYPTNRK